MLLLSLFLLLEAFLPHPKAPIYQDIQQRGFSRYDRDTDPKVQWCQTDLDARGFPFVPL